MPSLVLREEPCWCHTPYSACGTVSVTAPAKQMLNAIFTFLCKSKNPLGICFQLVKTGTDVFGKIKWSKVKAGDICICY